MDRSYVLGLVVHPRKPVGGSVRLITDFARRYDCTVLARETDAARVGPDVTLVPDDGFADRLDALVALGGDGTMLGAMRLVVGRPVPVLGVNHGSVGFLVEVTPDQLAAALDRLVEGRFTLEPHSCLDLAGVVGVAFNDVVVSAARPWTSVTLDLVVNGSRHGYYHGDAVIACTPTGSTAYNYAAGGPILSPSAAAVVVTPVAPMAGISRSAVLGASDEIRLTVAEDSAPVAVDVDGTAAGELKPGDALTARLRPDAARVVRLAAGTHASLSRVKLSLLDLPLRREQLLDLVPEELRQRARESFDGPRALG
jgi:NAD+ kinase